MNIASWIRQKLGSTQEADTPASQILNELEFVLVDIDVTGTDIHNDTATGFAALPMVNRGVKLSDLRYCRLPATPDDQADTDDFRAMLNLLAGRVVFTINPRFVGHMLAETCRRLKLPSPTDRWHDLADFARVVGDDTDVATSLAHWQENMRTGGRFEHDATYDVFAMAQLLQALLANAEDLNIRSMADLLSNQRADNWLRPY